MTEKTGGGAREGANSAQLANGRIICLVAAILVLAFGLAHQADDPEATNTLWIRGALAAVLLAVFAGSYRSKYVKHRVIPFARLCVFGMTTWIVSLAAVNGFSPAYAMGLIFSVAAAGVAWVVMGASRQLVAIYSGYTTAIVAAALFLVPAPDISILVFSSCIGGTLLVGFVASHLRGRLQDELEESERRFRILSNATFEAIFLVEDGSIVDCNQQAVRMLGYQSATEIIGQRAEALVPPNHRVRLERMEESGEMAVNEMAIVRRDGRMVPVEVKGRAMMRDGHEVYVIAAYDISKRKQLAADLVAARDSAEEMLRVKNAFLANVSHELRTPLALILGYAEMMVPEAKQEDIESLDVIIDNGRRLSDTISTLLELSQLEGSRMQPDPQQLNVVSIIEEVVAVHRTQAAAKGLLIELALPEREVFIVADRLHIIRVIDALVNNAVKFTNEGRVEVGLEVEDDKIRLYVDDTGIGISESFLPHIFDDFEQESAGLTRTHGGIGVGLSITRRLVSIMNGEITVESRKGSGSRFTVSLREKVGVREGGGLQMAN